MSWHKYNRKEVYLLLCQLITMLLLLHSISQAQAESAYKRYAHILSWSNELRVMTFNIRTDSFWSGRHRWNKRKFIVTYAIKSNSADIFGLQEAKNNQVQLIHRYLPIYDKYAVGRKNGKKRGETCAIFYRKDRFQLLDAGTFWFSNTPSKPGSKDWGNLFPRICSWIHLFDRTSSNKFYVYNVHLDNQSQNSRELSIRMLVEKIATRKIRDPFIVMGDFNMELTNPAMQYFQNHDSQTSYPWMIDAWQSLHFSKPQIGTLHGFNGGTSGPLVDHIWLCENIIPLEAKIDQRRYDGKYPSDHFPVVARILFKKNQSNNLSRYEKEK